MRVLASLTIATIIVACSASDPSLDPSGSDSSEHDDGSAMGSADADVDDGDDGNDDGGKPCGPGKLRCGGECVDVSTDPDACGICGRSCGDEELCSQGNCVAAPVDCGAAGSSCPVGHHCNVGTGTCEVGCAFDDDCPQPGSCDPATHRCSCDPGHLPCEDGCRPESADACGAACEVCRDAPPGGAPACIDGTCDFTCLPGSHRCADACVDDDDVDHCGSACSPCPSDPHGTADCDGGSCELWCDNGYHREGSGCVADCTSTSCGAQQWCDTGTGACNACTAGADESEPNDANAQASSMSGSSSGGSIWWDGTGRVCPLDDVDVWRVVPLDDGTMRFGLVVEAGDWIVEIYEGTFLLGGLTCSVDEPCNDEPLAEIDLFDDDPVYLHVRAQSGAAPLDYSVFAVQ